MRYVILLWGDEEAERALTSDERRAIVEAHGRFASQLRNHGRYVHGEALAPGGKVVRGGLVTDGPFADTKERIGGLYAVEVASEDEALELARAVPQSPGLVVEVLPVAET